MIPQTNIPKEGDILTELPTIGDCFEYPENNQDDKELDKLLQELEGYYMDSYYHEGFNNDF